MAHSRCLACRARVWREGNAGDHLADLCPGCGGALEPVTDLTELVGFRSLRARPKAVRRAPPDGSARIADQIRETIERHDAARGRRTDAGHDRDREPRDGRPTAT